MEGSVTKERIRRLRLTVNTHPIQRMERDNRAEEISGFAKLPPELRAVIWMATFESRFVCQCGDIRSRVAGYDALTDQFALPRAETAVIPVAFHVNQESRYHARRLYLSRKMIDSDGTILTWEFFNPNVDFAVRHDIHHNGLDSAQWDSLANPPPSPRPTYTFLTHKEIQRVSAQQPDVLSYGDTRLFRSETLRNLALVDIDMELDSRCLIPPHLAQLAPGFLQEFPKLEEVWLMGSELTGLEYGPSLGSPEAVGPVALSLDFLGAFEIAPLRIVGHDPVTETTVVKHKRAFGVSFRVWPHTGLVEARPLAHDRPLAEAGIERSMLAHSISQAEALDVHYSYGLVTDGFYPIIIHVTIMRGTVGLQPVGNGWVELGRTCRDPPVLDNLPLTGLPGLNPLPIYYAPRLPKAARDRSDRDSLVILRTMWHDCVSKIESHPFHVFPVYMSGECEYVPDPHGHHIRAFEVNLEVG